MLAICQPKTLKNRELNNHLITSIFLDSLAQICYYFVKVDYSAARLEDSAYLTHNVILKIILKEILYSIS